MAFIPYANPVLAAATLNSGGTTPSPTTVGEPSGSGAYVPGVSTQTAPAGAPSTLSNLSPVTSSTTGTTSGPTAAQIAAQANYNNLLGGYNTETPVNIAAGATTYGNSILDDVTANKNSQLGINQQSIQNELSKDQGLQGVTDMVNNGIQGGGVVLDNDNAGTSSAADALARAYGVQGRQQASSVGNQYAQGQNTISTAQTQLGNTEAAQLDPVSGDLAKTKQQTIASIVDSANQSLTYLSAIGNQTGDVADQVNIAQQIATVKAQATAALTALDGQLSGVTTTPSAQADNQAAAQKLLTSGTAPANQFNYTTVAPATLQNTGPAASNLPIYLSPSNKTTVPATA